MDPFTPPSDDDLDPPDDLTVTIAKAWDRIDDLLERRVPPVSTGFPLLDAAMGGGFPRGQVSVIAGFPGVGTTTYAIDRTVSTMLDERRPVGFVAVADAPDEVLVKMMIRAAKVDRATVYGGTGDDEVRFRLAEAGAALDAGRLVVEQPIVRTREGMRIAGESAAYHPLGADLVLVDGLDQLDDPAEYGPALRDLKGVAAGSGAAVVVTTHLRDPGHARNPEDQWIFDLQSLGAAAEIAAAVIILHRDDRWKRDNPRSGEVDLLLAKNPFGGPGRVVGGFSPLWGDIQNLDIG
ncbi:hypothetical protein GOHSU_53_00120 [Gordonia hirsuta DSM 44140 = NBRC 16056]|uniref:SF4 helicase domain-containing protein n=1 Tax=Gordonia hirsuta DSM 44140 = NBRC 16056 TaxID=1121927 RepID=L7LCF5_9ACTN|nr:DnaB-like helicase C-terminal domain-containing protein [Gordonia hirsuta]GAC58810.1 hypothetical protein GOHSU_53_00120 [Gordonia hirsuta DSM 44140 = NBRC 16056]